MHLFAAFSCKLLQLICILMLLANAYTQPQLHMNQRPNLKVVCAVNAGGGEHTDKLGIHYAADPLQNKIGTASDYGNHLLIIGRVPEQDELLYRTERYHTASFGYDLPLDGDGDYALILKFCEVYFNEPNMKVFDVVLNKRHTIVAELDIFHQVGRGTAHEEYVFFKIQGNRLFYKQEQSEVQNGIIRLDFIKSMFDNPKINAFVMFKGDVGNIPRLAPVSADDMLPMDADMAVFHDRVSADSGKLHLPQRYHAVSRPAAAPPQQYQSPMHSQASKRDGFENFNDEDDEQQQQQQADNDEDSNMPRKLRHASGPRHPNPYGMDDSSIMLPVFIALGAFIPLLFCLCKL